MADIITGASSAAGSGQLSNQILTAYQRSAFFALREDVVFDQYATVRPGNMTSPGNPVKFPFWADMSPNTTALNEVVDVDARTVSDSLVTVTPAEYGDAILLTIRLRTDDFLIGFDSDISNLLNQLMVDTIEELARQALDGGSNVEYAQVGAASAEADITSSDDLTTAIVIKKRAQLRAAKVKPWDGSNYLSVIHPDVLHDLVSETGAGSFVGTTQYNDASRIFNYEYGTLYGIRFIESANAKLNPDGGASAVDTYTTYFFGAEMLAKAESIPPHMVMGPVTDKLMRFQPLGWHGYLGYDTLREAALRRVISCSTIGSNS